MIHVNKLRYRYPPLQSDGDWVTALNPLTFEVDKGGCLAVVGPNNSGKSTLCLSVAGLAPRLTAGHIEGTITVDDHDVQSVRPGALVETIGFVMQDLTGQLFNPTVEAEIAWGLENLGLPPNQIHERIDHALALVRLDAARDHPPKTLSGGQQKRLALATALALRPKVLILDEPSAGLSPLARHDLIELLQELRQSTSLTILMAESDAAFITALADQVILLKDGQARWQGSPRALYNTLQNEPISGIAQPVAVRFAVAVNQTGNQTISGLTLEEVVESIGNFRTAARVSSTASTPVTTPENPLPDSPDAAIHLEGITFSYVPTNPVLRGIDLSIPRGQFAVLTGDNGAGKTTLARHLVGLLRPSAGRVSLMGEDMAQWSIGRMAQQVGLAFQNPELQIFSATVRDEIAFGPRNLGKEETEVNETIGSVLRRFRIEHLAEMPPAALSFSDRRLTALASIAAMQTPIIVLDEPTVGLDAVGCQTVMDWLVQQHHAGATILLITHDMELAARYAARLLVLHDGFLAADGDPHTIFFQEAVLMRAGLESPFAVRFARALGNPALAGDLTPEGAARCWVEAVS